MNLGYGPERLLADLRDLGFEPEHVVVNPGCSFAVLRDYLVEAGRFQGRIIGLGFHCTADFPRSVHSSIHVRAQPQLFEYGNIPGTRNIQASPLGPEWQYWSKNFNW